MRTQSSGFCNSCILAAALLSADIAGAAAPDGAALSVDWSTIDAGGGTSTGGNFSVSGSIAQIEADPLQPASGGNLQITGGFWVLDTGAAPEQLFRNGFE